MNFVPQRPIHSAMNNYPNTISTNNSQINTNNSNVALNNLPAKKPKYILKD